MHNKNFLEKTYYCNLLDKGIEYEDCVGCGECLAATEAHKPEAVKSNSSGLLSANDIAIALCLTKTILDKVEKRKDSPEWLKGSLGILHDTLAGKLK